MKIMGDGKGKFEKSEKYENNANLGSNLRVLAGPRKVQIFVFFRKFRVFRVFFCPGRKCLWEEFARIYPRRTGWLEGLQFDRFRTISLISDFFVFFVFFWLFVGSCLPPIFFIFFFFSFVNDFFIFFFIFFFFSEAPKLFSFFFIKFYKAKEKKYFFLFCS